MNIGRALPSLSSIARMLALSTLVLLGACKTELYSSLSETDANAMVAILHRANIEADKQAAKDNLFSVQVEQSQFARAVEILDQSGYPRKRYDSFKEIFSSGGLIPTPFEEKIRFLYGLSEELAHTISLFEGVLETRVHVTLPEESNSTATEDIPQENLGKASVYIKYDPLFDFVPLLPRIKSLVSDSIEGVSYERVEVLALPASTTPLTVEPVAYIDLLGIQVRAEDYRYALAGVVAAIAVVVLALGAGIHFYRRAQA
ncbi:MAG: type III secretion inner membrane ring lipoprotein SctJ [Hyphomicrobiales bacterium]|nr:type III secretion inner membrane ring lipoprotein SctJ [Hyphomicrobiales bacterium]MCY4033778.1 type III secretion inner membrane ring lipoprotein SctJ [Hyphomicrobiales bacterium]MCY4039413.1 type III secretion inner membrane ring lipoprotein SctJ [Hyphomicrobiales bacterium]